MYGLSVPERVRVAAPRRAAAGRAEPEAADLHRHRPACAGVADVGVAGGHRAGAAPAPGSGLDRRRAADPGARRPRGGRPGRAARHRPVCAARGPLTPLRDLGVVVGTAPLTPLVDLGVVVGPNRAIGHVWATTTPRSTRVCGRGRMET